MLSAQRKQPHSCSSLPGIKIWPQIPMHHSAANTHACVNSWATSHQTNSNMRKCSSGTTYKYHIPNTPGNCRSLPYGTPRAASASMLSTKTRHNNLPNKSLRQSWKVIAYITIPTKQPWVPDSTEDSTNSISYTMTTLKPQKAQMKQVPWLALINLIIIISTKHHKTALAET